MRRARVWLWFSQTVHANTNRSRAVASCRPLPRSPLPADPKLSADDLMTGKMVSAAGMVPPLDGASAFCFSGSSQPNIASSPSGREQTAASIVLAVFPRQSDLGDAAVTIGTVPAGLGLSQQCSTSGSTMALTAGSLAASCRTSLSPRSKPSHPSSQTWNSLGKESAVSGSRSSAREMRVFTHFSRFQPSSSRLANRERLPQLETHPGR
jgi:hypothetical protein